MHLRGHELWLDMPQGRTNTITLLNIYIYIYIIKTTPNDRLLYPEIGTSLNSHQRNFPLKGNTEVPKCPRCGIKTHRMLTPKSDTDISPQGSGCLQNKEQKDCKRWITSWKQCFQEITEQICICTHSDVTSYTRPVQTPAKQNPRLEGRRYEILPLAKALLAFHDCRKKGSPMFCFVLMWPTVDWPTHQTKSQSQNYLATQTGLNGEREEG